MTGGGEPCVPVLVGAAGRPGLEECAAVCGVWLGLLDAAPHRFGDLQTLCGDGEVSLVRKSTNLEITDPGQVSAFCSQGETQSLMRTPRKTLIYTDMSRWP